VTAGFDPLRDEGEAYADAMRAAGGEVKLVRFAGLLHGFANMITVSPACRTALEQVADHTRAMLERESYGGTEIDAD
jgi:acetyl esterase